MRVFFCNKLLSIRILTYRKIKTPARLAQGLFVSATTLAVLFEFAKLGDRRKATQSFPPVELQMV